MARKSENILGFYLFKMHILIHKDHNSMFSRINYDLLLSTVDCMISENHESCT